MTSPPERVLDEIPARAATLSVVIVDDHVALRRGMELLLRRDGHSVVGTADDAPHGYELLLRRRPDVAVIDLGLPGENGADLTRRVLADVPGMRILLYTGLPDESSLGDAVNCGARGVALKAGAPAELLNAIRAVAEGRRYLDPRLQSLVRGEWKDEPAVLSPREREVLTLLAEGLSGEQTAKRLFLSSETVRTHVRNATTKLGASTRVHAVALAMQRGEIAL